MNSDGSHVEPLYDPSSNEADIDWKGDCIVFTKESCTWVMHSDGTGVRQITHPPEQVNGALQTCRLEIMIPESVRMARKSYSSVWCTTGLRMEITIFALQIAQVPAN